MRSAELADSFAFLFVIRINLDNLEKGTRYEMKNMICESCGKHYDFHKDETCPRCGSYNNPNHRTTRRTQSNPAGSQQRNSASTSIKTKKPASRKKLVAVWSIVGIVLLKLLSVSIQHWDDFHVILSAFGKPEPEIVEVQEEIEQPIEEIEQDIPIEDLETEQELFYVPLTDGNYKFLPADGVQFVVHECGYIQNEDMEHVLEDGDQLVYVNVTFFVTDWEIAVDADLTEPYIYADEYYYDSISPEELGYTGDPIDFSPIGAGETDTVSGDLYFILPSGTDEFELCWDSYEVGTESFSIPYDGSSDNTMLSTI